MKSQLFETKRQCAGSRLEGGPLSGTPGRLGAFRESKHVNIWERGRRSVTLATGSYVQCSGASVLQVRDPAYLDIVDLGPADFAPCLEDDPPETAAELLVQIHAKRPLTGEALDCARRFLSQWPEGPQLPEKGRVLAPNGLPRGKGRPQYPLAT